MKAKTNNKTARKGRLSLSTLICVLAIIAGAAVMAYPTLANWWNNFHQSQALNDYLQAIDNTDADLIETMLADAESYNERLLGNSNRLEMTDTEKMEYKNLLDLNGSGIIGYIDIPKLHIQYPIYHGTEEDVLQVAIGHIEGSSLPVGGESTHAVVSGHRGLPSAVLFSDLDDLEIGDRFTVTVLTRTLTYEVNQIHIVEPEDVTDLQITKGEDYMTLVTCTPYAINSHRLLVRGRRVATGEETPPVADASRISTNVVLVGVALPLLVAYLLISIIIDRNRQKIPDSHDIMENVRLLYENEKQNEGKEGGDE